MRQAPITSTSNSCISIPSSSSAARRFRTYTSRIASKFPTSASTSPRSSSRRPAAMSSDCSWKAILSPRKISTSSKCPCLRLSKGVAAPQRPQGIFPHTPSYGTSAVTGRAPRGQPHETSHPDHMNMPNASAPSDFVRAIVAEDLKTGKHGGRVVTRFPPEPNGYLHIGHAKSICLNFGIANENPGGVCHLRFDDTNPTTEDPEYVQAIQEDVRWLGFDWRDKMFFASDYFEQFYEYAVRLIKKGKAYVDSLTADEIRQFRGTLTEPGKDSPYRNRSVEENLDLFRRMRAGEFPDGAHVLRAKIDMASPNINLRDPVLYRIRRARHYRTGDTWCIYPTYDYAHPLSDAIEGITHSICTLEFEDHRPLYDWVVEQCETQHRPRQIEFARLNLTHTVMSKRKLLDLVERKLVNGWDDPRLP